MVVHALGRIHAPIQPRCSPAASSSHCVPRCKRLSYRVVELSRKPSVSTRQRPICMSASVDAPDARKGDQGQEQQAPSPKSTPLRREEAILFQGKSQCRAHQVLQSKQPCEPSTACSFIICATAELFISQGTLKQANLDPQVLGGVAAM